MAIENIAGNEAFARDEQMLHFLQWFHYKSKMAFFFCLDFHLSLDSFLVDKS